MTKTAILAAMTAILLPYGALASASEAPSPHLKMDRFINI
jgi:hypothetical protein